MTSINFKTINDITIGAPSTRGPSRKGRMTIEFTDGSQHEITFIYCGTDKNPVLVEVGRVPLESFNNQFKIVGMELNLDEPISRFLIEVQKVIEVEQEAEKKATRIRLQKFYHNNPLRDAYEIIKKTWKETDYTVEYTKEDEYLDKLDHSRLYITVLFDLNGSPVILTCGKRTYKEGYSISFGDYKLKSIAGKTETRSNKGANIANMITDAIRTVKENSCSLEAEKNTVQKTITELTKTLCRPVFARHEFCSQYQHSIDGKVWNFYVQISETKELRLDLNSSNKMIHTSFGAVTIGMYKQLLDITHPQA